MGRAVRPTARVFFHSQRRSIFFPMERNLAKPNLNMSLGEPPPEATDTATRTQNVAQGLRVQASDTCNEREDDLRHMVGQEQSRAAVGFRFGGMHLPYRCMYLGRAILDEC